MGVIAIAQRIVDRLGTNALELIREDAAAVERERIAEKFPTGAYVQLSCEVDRWADLGKAACKLEVRRYPVEELA